MYTVVKDFTDLKDNNHVYRAGDKFPRKGARVSDERVAELASSDNKRGEVLIKAVEGARSGKIAAESDENEVIEEVVVKLNKRRKKQNKKEN